MKDCYQRMQAFTLARVLVMASESASSLFFTSPLEGALIKIGERD